MFFLGLINKLFKILNSDDTPFQVAIGFSLAMLIEFTPFLSVQNIVLIFIAFILNISFKSFLLGIVSFGLISYLFIYPFHYLGKIFLVDNQVFYPIFNFFFNLPLMNYTNLNNSVALGGFLSALVLFIPIVLVINKFIKYYREKLKDKITNSKFYKIFSKNKIFVIFSKVLKVLPK